MGHGMFLCGLGSGNQSPPAGDSDTSSPGAVRASALVVRDLVG